MQIKNINGILHATLRNKGKIYEFTGKNYKEIFKKTEKIIGHPYAI